MADFDTKLATVDLKVTPEEEKAILEMRKPLITRVAELSAKAEAYKTYLQSIKNI